MTKGGGLMPDSVSARVRRSASRGVARAGSAAVVYLSDGTAWEIRPENRPLAATWPAKTPIGVYKVDDRDWQYRLVLRPGKSDGDMVAARKMRRIR